MYALSLQAYIHNSASQHSNKKRRKKGHWVVTYPKARRQPRHPSHTLILAGEVEVRMLDRRRLRQLNSPLGLPYVRERPRAMQRRSSQSRSISSTFSNPFCQLQSLIRDSVVEYTYFSSVLCSTRLVPAYIGRSPSNAWPTTMEPCMRWILGIWSWDERTGRCRLGAWVHRRSISRFVSVLFSISNMRLCLMHLLLAMLVLNLRMVLPARHCHVYDLVINVSSCSKALDELALVVVLRQRAVVWT